MKSIKVIILLFFSLNLSCLATLETAKVKKGYNIDIGFEYQTLNFEKELSYAKDIDHSSYTIKSRITKGYEYKIPFELGISLGVFTQPQFRVYVVKESYEDEYKSYYYPYENKAKAYWSYFTKVQIYNKNDVAIAIRPQFFLDKFGSISIIVSKNFEKYVPYFSVKIFNRFIPNIEEKIDNKDLGYYISIGSKYVLGRYRQKSPFGYLLEIGLVKNYWYNDKFGVIISAGISIK